MELKLGNEQVNIDNEIHQRLSLFLWGAPGTGKTVLACTAPGDILLLNFDPDGYTSVNYRENVAVIDLSIEGASSIELLKQDQPQFRHKGKLFTLSTILKENPNIQTIVVDSTTALLHMALKLAITQPAIVRQSGKLGASMEVPTMSGWTARNMFVQQVMANILRVSGALGVHCIFIGHEEIEKDNDGKRVGDSPNISEKLLGTIASALSEIWALSDTGHERRITFRNSRGKKPTKTRMFSQQGDAEFVCRYNAEIGKGDGLSAWIESWKNAKYTKILPPK